MRIQVKKSYKIIGFHKICPKNYMQRLLVLGFLPGSTFIVKNIAPLGNPYQLFIRNCLVFLRKRDLDLIQVENA